MADSNNRIRNVKMLTLSNILEAEQIDVLKQKEFEIDCCIRGYHCTV